MRLPGIVLALGLSAVSAAAQTDPTAKADQPRLRPTADVDVTYRVTGPGAMPDGGWLEQRVRWLAAAQALRIDPPSKGFHVIIDYLAGHMSVVREVDRSVLEMTAPAGMAGLPGAASSAVYTRRGEDTVAGIGCTDWETADRQGQRTLACITADGVLLRARVGERTLVSAIAVHYAPQDFAAFRIPPDYTRRKAGAAP